MRDVLTIHRDTIRHEGGRPGLRDPGLLDAAVRMPVERFSDQYLHPSLAAMAAAYLFHLAKNHPFVDGNKRVALSAALLFLLANDVEALPDEDEAADVTIAVAAGEIGKDALVAWFTRVTGTGD
ncbi:MAG: type II toxin-antitoxin system death-on-curing family toxin [Myxococcales bacterium]|nr:type II toxin-antitoxin system death-on-curing family toxin [Myxococcales bacterium]